MGCEDLAAGIGRAGLGVVLVAGAEVALSHALTRSVFTAAACTVAVSAPLAAAVTSQGG